LLDYFRKRTFTEVDSKEVQALVEGLGAEDFSTREQAYERLLVLGAAALRGIKDAEKSKDPEVSRRADLLRLRIESKAEPSIQSAAARLVARTKPAGAAEVLHNFLPFAADQDVTDAICRSLAGVAVVADRVEPCLVDALNDRLAIKRAAAGEALARAQVT